MKKNLLLSIGISIILTALSSCETDDPTPDETENPFKNEEGWNGFYINNQEYSTPNAIIEIWGENLDSMSSDYDISFTDGTFDYASRNIVQENILLYLDANSPSLDEFSAGTYRIENTDERKPGNIVDAYIQITNSTRIVRYPIMGGEVTVQEENGFYSIEYELESIVDSEPTTISGKYSGYYTIIDQTKL